MSNTIGVNDLLEQMRAMRSQIDSLQLPIKNIEVNSVEGGAKVDTQDAFSSVLKKSINSVNDAQMNTAKLQEAFQNGDPNVEIAEVMIAMQKSNVSFQAMVQVRNKIVQAYQEIMNMPV